MVKIDAIEPIIGSDNCECAVIGGWHIMVRKNTFKVNDLAIYFEIDSKVDETNPAFSFLAKKHYAVKTQRYTFGGKGNFISQGLLMAPSDFGWYSNDVKTAVIESNAKDNSGYHAVNDESRFLTQILKITYADSEDNKRKANSFDKYKKMAQRNGKLFSHQPFRWLMKRTWGKKFLFVFFGKKRDKKTAWPEWVQKTDEERCQNIPWIVNDKSEWIATEKIDGSSTTFTMKRKLFNRFDFYICSRNVVFDKPDKPCYYETNIYTEMAEKYNIKAILRKILICHPEWKWITLQGETYGTGIQKRDYSLTEIHNRNNSISGHDFAGFNFITSADGRWNSRKAARYLIGFGIPWVPFIDDHFILPNSIEELIDIATGESAIDGKPREGIVFRSPDGTRSFKAVSNEYLCEFHG